MCDPQFKQQQVDGLRAPYVAPINALVAELTPAGGLARQLADEDPDAASLGRAGAQRRRWARARRGASGTVS